MTTRSQQGPITQYATARAYLERNKIPQMFESLIASLMMERPENHFNYLDKQLNMIKEVGLENVNWETFIQDLHPLRDQTRLDLIHDEVSEKIRSESGAEAKRPKGKEEEDEDYQSDVFQLTEAQD